MNTKYHLLSAIAFVLCLNMQAQNVLNPTLSSLTSYSINKSKAVGEIPCNTNVSANGAVTINVPIDIYRSPDGFDPQISINYNSMGGISIMGYGWSLSTGSTISCTNKSIY